MPKAAAISVDEYLSKRSLSAHDGVVYRAAKMPKSFNAETRSATFVMTDETVDSYGDIVRAKGCDLSRFEDNPICLLNHRSDLVLGTWSDVKRIVKRVEGTATLAAEGTAPHVDMAYNLMSQGILKACSIGFMPLKVERRLDEDGEPLWSYDILEWQMFECSVVSVPSNPNALAKSMKEGCTLSRDLLEEVLDTYIKTPAGLILPIAEVEKAYKDGSGEKTVAVIEKTDESAEEKSAADEVAEGNKSVNEARKDAGLPELPPADLESKDVEGAVVGAKRDTDGMTDDQVNKLAEAGVVFVTEIEIDGKTYNGDVVASSWDAAEKMAAEREPAEKIVAQLTQVGEIDADEEGIKSLTEKKSSVNIDIDTDEATEKMTALEAVVDRVTSKIAKFFKPKEAPVVEPPAPPSAEEKEAALSKAAAVRERLASKGLIEA